MVKHIVMWKLKDEHNGMNKAELTNEMKKQLLALKNDITELVSIDVGINTIHPEKNSDIVLTTEFKSFDDLNAYAIHPEHLKVVDFVKQIVVERACVDYEF